MVENDGRRSVSPSNITDDVRQDADNLAKDLIEITRHYAISGPAKDQAGNQLAEILVTDFIQALCIYIVDRDQKILNHGIRRGYRLGVKEAASVKGNGAGNA